MTTLYYGYRPISNGHRAFAEDDIDMFVSNYQKSKSLWWESLDVFIGKSRDVVDYFNKVKYNIVKGVYAQEEAETRLRDVPYTARVCPGIGDLFKDMLVVKTPCDFHLTITPDGVPIANAVDPDLFFISSHSPRQFHTMKNNLFENKINVKFCTNVLMRSTKPLRGIYLPPSYHANHEFDVLPGVIDYNRKPLDLNINTVFDVPEKENKTYFFREGTPLAYVWFDSKPK